jgi:hypothetical protein
VIEEPSLAIFGKGVRLAISPSAHACPSHTHSKPSVPHAWSHVVPSSPSSHYSHCPCAFESSGAELWSETPRRRLCLLFLSIVHIQIHTHLK